MLLRWFVFICERWKSLDLVLLSAAADECEVASATYDCGVEKLPAITQNMVAVGKGDNVVVNILYLFVVNIL